MFTGDFVRLKCRCIILISLLFVSCATFDKTEYDSSCDGMWEIVRYYAKGKVTKFPTISKGKKYRQFHYLRGKGRAWLVYMQIDMKTGERKIYSFRKHDFRYKVAGSKITFDGKHTANIVRKGNRMTWKYPNGNYEVNINRTNEFDSRLIKRY